MLGPADRMRGIDRKNLADYQPLKQHADGRVAL
jgi:hypothetical protein